MARRRSLSPLRRLAEDLARGTRAETVFGQPVAQDDLVVIPVAHARFAFGGGGGHGPRRREAGEGGGGAAVVRPAGYIELRRGRARYRRIRSVSREAALISIVTVLVLAWRAARDSRSAAERARTPG